MYMSLYMHACVYMNMYIAISCTCAHIYMYGLRREMYYTCTFYTPNSMGTDCAETNIFPESSFRQPYTSPNPPRPIILWILKSCREICTSKHNYMHMYIHKYIAHILYKCLIGCMVHVHIFTYSGNLCCVKEKFKW